MRLPFTTNGDTLTLFMYGVPETIDSSHPNYTTIYDLVVVQGVHDDVDVNLLANLLSVKKTIEEAIKGQNFGAVTVGQDSVLFNGQVINTYLTQKMLALLSTGADITPWALFMDKLYKNPSKTAVDELFLWLDKAGMPITEDGCFLAYKKVQDDYTSFHDHKFLNLPGTTVEMPRNQVDDNRNKTCSYGLHFCSWHYLPSYYGGSGRVVLVKIDPSEVVSIPSDYDNAKGRAHRYTIVGEIDESRTTFAFEGQHVYDGEYDY